MVIMVTLMVTDSSLLIDLCTVYKMNPPRARNPRTTVRIQITRRTLTKLSTKIGTESTAQRTSDTMRKIKAAGTTA